MTVRAKPSTALLLCLIALSTGCASGGGGGVELESDVRPSGPSVLDGSSRISTIEVVLDEEAVGSNVSAVANRHSASEALEADLRGHLAESVDSNGSLKVRIDIVGFRLRSTGSAMWWGFFAGSDWVTVDVDVTNDGRSVRRFRTGISTSLGGFVYGSSSKRVNRMMDALGERIAQRI